MRTGFASLPLHHGQAPRWLTRRMARLGREIVTLMAEEYGSARVLEQLADPFWFQAFGCVLGFDWHSSGVTTTVCSGLKEGLEAVGSEIGLYVCGGKGGRSRKTPEEVRAHCEKTGQDAEVLVHASRMAAKIDSVALQDGYQLYQHTFFFDATGNWCVIQQGMADESDPLGLPHRGLARRYHWLGTQDTIFDCEPHRAICSDGRGQLALNFVAEESARARTSAIGVLNRSPRELVADLGRLPTLTLASRHPILTRDLNPKRVKDTLLMTYASAPRCFTELVGARGVGPKAMRALALISEVVHGDAPSFRDPARYSFAHGGKDGTPYPVELQTYEQSIEALKTLLDRSRIDRADKTRAFRRLAQWAKGH